MMSGRIGEIKSLTGLRGVASALVMVYHLATPNFAKPQSSTFINHGYLAVDLFLILSGFVLGLTYIDKMRYHQVSYFSFLVHRLIRLWPLYAVLTLAYLAGDLIQEKPITALAISSNFAMVQAWGGISPSLINPGWSISAEWLACLVFPLASFVAINSGLRGSILSLVGSLIALVALAHLKSQRIAYVPSELLNITNWRSPAPMARCLADFVIGLSVYAVFINREKRPEIMSSGLFGVVVLFFMFLSMSVDGLDVCFVFLGGLLVLHLGSDRGPVAFVLKNRYVCALGRWSYAIYLVHFGLREACFLLEKNMAHYFGRNIGDVLAIFMTCVGAVAMAFALHNWFDMPTQRYLRRRFDEWRCSKSQIVFEKS